MSISWPTSYDAWRHCLSEQAGITPTLAYFKERHRILSDPTQPESKRFQELYGEKRRRPICQWLEQSIQEEEY